jgi:predicted transcriptional regulator
VLPHALLSFCKSPADKIPAARSVRALAQRLQRDYKRVHEDVETLTELGLLQRDDGRVAATYDVIHADFDLRSAA